MKKLYYTTVLLFCFFHVSFAQRGLETIENNRLFKVMLEINEHKVISRSNEYFRMQAVKVKSDERVQDDDEIQSFKSFYYLIIADFGESPRGKLYQTENLIAPTIEILPNSYRYFKIVIKHGAHHEKQLVLFASNEKVYVKKE